MGAAKELWFAEMERLTGAYIDEGMDPQDAYEKACDRAHTSAYERLVDRADIERKRAREQG